MWQATRDKSHGRHKKQVNAAVRRSLTETSTSLVSSWLYSANGFFGPKAGSKKCKVQKFGKRTKRNYHHRNHHHHNDQHDEQNDPPVRRWKFKLGYCLLEAAPTLQPPLNYHIIVITNIIIIIIISRNFCGYLCCFVAKSVLRGEKFSKKLSPWRKMTSIRYWWNILASCVCSFLISVKAWKLLIISDTDGICALMALI